ncbi:NRDE protein-domain-containing protein [Sporodiniella umbellata]|nr:NRDE protein-domain-containing protein [Sporodiniella umbellata]
MCILFWTVDNHPKYKFIFAGNRDEFLARPAAKAHFWESDEHILAGIDLGAQSLETRNGTWLGITRQGRFAALTNFREKSKADFLSRGALVENFLQGSLKTEAEHLEKYAGFNLVCFDFGKKAPEMLYLTNRGEKSLATLESKKVYGLSNSLLQNPWEKVIQGKRIFKNVFTTEEDEEKMIKRLFNMLKTGDPMPQIEGYDLVSKNLQQRIFITNFYGFEYQESGYLGYATRTSTVVLIDYDGNVTFVERDWYNTKTFQQLKPSEYEDRLFRFQLEK